MERIRIRRALLSVTDKTDLVEFASFLESGGVELISTGGTARVLSEAGLKATPVDQVTGFPEILGGRVKTLHPAIHGAILADRSIEGHMATLVEHGIAPIDLVCVNLYNFAEAAAKGLDLKNAVEQIDIGGPTMIRAAAKNFHGVLVVPDTGLYKRVMDEMSASDMHVSLPLRKEASAAAFAAVSRYDAMIADYLASRDA